MTGRAVFSSGDWRGMVNSKVVPWPGGAVEVDLAAVELDEGLDQAEAEADPPLAELVVARGVVHGVEAGEERLEQVGPIGRPGCRRPRRRPGTGPARRLAGARAAIRIVPPSGVNLIALTSRFVRMSASLAGSTSALPRSGCEVEVDVTAPRTSRNGCELVDDLRGPAARARSSFEVERLAELVGPDELEHPLDRDGQPPGGELDPLDPAALGGRGGLAQRGLPELGHPQDDGHRGVQLVAGDLDEGRLEPVGLGEPLVRRLQLGQEPGRSRRSGRAARRPGGRRPASSSGSQGLVM